MRYIKKLVAFNDKKKIQQELVNSIMIIIHCFNRYTVEIL
jgi:hypothetical protein